MGRVWRIKTVKSRFRERRQQAVVVVVLWSECHGVMDHGRRRSSLFLCCLVDLSLPLVGQQIGFVRVS